MHSPQQPKSGQSVKISVSIASDYTDIAMQYQIAEPGNYIELQDPQYAKDWTPLAIQAGAASKGRTLYTAEFPADLQKHRRLIRYRITAKDAAGKSLLAPMIPAAVAST